ncbi:type IV pilin N-terminal domain-containing protein [Methanoregula sp.]|uniref:type IV pilin N-terminal domain-containing protein n=1 Tax=Methanoregula sp. TaxID=2052170 RepID=UPI0035650ED5
MIPHKDAAVSPVVGVMLMLVVTIIIAAVVSAFAGGMGSEQHKTPQVTISVRSDIHNIQGTISPTSPYTLTYPPGFTAANGLLFENTGGDTFTLNDIEIQLQHADVMYLIKPTDTPSPAIASEDYPGSILTPGITTGGYFGKIGNTSTSDITIAPGDKFKLYADGCAQAVTYTWAGGSSYYGPKLSWRPTGTERGIAFYLDDKIQYKLIDRASSRVMATGEVVLT